MKLSCLAKEFPKETRNAIKLLLENKNFLIEAWKGSNKRGISYDYLEEWTLVPSVDEKGFWDLLDTAYKSKDVLVYSNSYCEIGIKCNLMRYFSLRLEYYFNKVDYFTMDMYQANQKYYFIEHKGEIYCFECSEEVKEIWFGNFKFNGGYMVYVVTNEYRVMLSAGTMPKSLVPLVWKGDEKSFRRALLCDAITEKELDSLIYMPLHDSDRYYGWT